MNEFVLSEIIENIMDLLKEYEGRDKADLSQEEIGRVFAYAECLQIIHDDIPEGIRKRVGIDFDIEKRYLY